MGARTVRATCGQSDHVWVNLIDLGGTATNVALMTEGEQSIYFWPLTIGAPLMLLMTIGAVVQWPRLKSPREILGESSGPGGHSTDAAAIWAGMGISVAVFTDIFAEWANRLEIESAFITATQRAGMGFGAACLLAAFAIYLFGRPSVLIPPNLRGDTGHAVLWWRALRHHRAGRRA